MITRKDLERLAKIRSHHGILSAYIPVDPKRIQDRRHPVTEFKSALKRFLQRPGEARWREAAERERDRVLGFLDNWKPSGRGLAIFSCEPDSLWELLMLNVPVSSLVEVHSTIRTAMLARLLDEYPRFIVALVQSDRARIYVAEQRQAVSEATIESEVPGRHDQGGWSQARFQRHIDFHMGEHLKKVVEELESLYYHQPFNRVAIGGSEEAVHELVRMLPEPIARRLIGTFAVDLKHEHEEQILERARRVREDHERRTEMELVDRVVNAAGGRGHGTLGLGPTIRAVREGRVHTLVVVEGIEESGSICPACGYFGSDEIERCLACGGATEVDSDIIDRAVEAALLSGAQVETVSGSARERLLDHGGLAAVLRY